MRDELKRYYENELIYLRQFGAEFAEKHPNVASHLLMGGPKFSEDPHVERLAEAFAFLAARIHLKLDDDFPEITESFLNVVYPQFLRPIPSLSVAEFAVDPDQGKLTTTLRIPRNTTLHSSRPVDGVSCKFRTCYETVVPPVRISRARWVSPERLNPALNVPNAAAACVVELACFPDVNFKMLGLQSLPFYLHGETNLMHSLYELLFNNCAEIVLRNPVRPEQSIPLPAKSLRPMGFREDESVLPFSRRSFTGYRVLQEYFSFPEKFFFFELNHLDALLRDPFEDRVEIVFLISSFERADRQQSLELGISDKTFRLGCSPVINLFSQTSEPVIVDQTKFEFPIVPDVRRRNAVEVFSVDEVLASSPERRDVVHYEPFYASRHAQTNKSQTFWHATRRESLRQDDAGTDVFLSLVDTSGRVAQNGAETVTARCTCTNRDLPSRLPFGNASGDFEMEGGGAIRRITALLKPTPTLRPPLRKGVQWQLISHLSLNYLSLVEEGRGALQNILRLYNFTDSKVFDRQISGIANLTSKRHFARVVSEHGISFARGIRVEMELDEVEFGSSGVFLFASVLEYFLGLYTSLNSFSQLVVRTKQRKGVLREWQPRAGQKILL